MKKRYKKKSTVTLMASGTRDNFKEAVKHDDWIQDFTEKMKPKQNQPIRKMEIKQYNVLCL